MRPIRYTEPSNTQPTNTSFIGDQIKSCEAFGFEISDPMDALQSMWFEKSVKKTRASEEQADRQGRELMVQKIPKLNYYQYACSI